jgi:acyl-CoA synthetase (AMP-forming)/AMP-acid ligase II
LQVFLEEEGVGERCRRVRQVMSSGEALSYELEERYYERMGRGGRGGRGGVGELANLYGPTEAAVDVSWWECERAAGAAGAGGAGGAGEEARGERGGARKVVPIGRPISNVRLYVMDERGERVQPVGVVGELCIGGVGLARGYVGKAELTAEKFIPDPYAEKPGERIYRTGDLARYLAGGEIEYIGRKDEQVKVRGYRIELGEIESILRQHAGMIDCAVIARTLETVTASSTHGEGAGAGVGEGAGEKQIVAYLVTAQEHEPSISALRTYLRERLPEYMLPASWLYLQELPLTPSGKLDRRSLPAPDEHRPELSESYVPARTATEVMLADIWAQVLKVERVGVNDNFFELGGHSLLATLVISRVREVLHIDLAIPTIFESPTLVAFAEVVEAKRNSMQGSAPGTAPGIQPVSRSTRRARISAEGAIIGPKDAREEKEKVE